jgi:hypothetical protein
MSTADPEPLRILWRMRGVRRIVTAGIYSHPAGWELRVSFEGQADDILHTQVHRFDRGVLEEKAEEMRAALREKGWLDVETTDTPQ